MHLLAYQMCILSFVVNERTIIKRIQVGNDTVSHCLAVRLSALALICKHRLLKGETLDISQSCDSPGLTHHVSPKDRRDEGLVRELENSRSVLQDVDIAEVDLSGVYEDHGAFSNALYVTCLHPTRGRTKGQVRVLL